MSIPFFIPRAREDGLVIEPLGEDLLVYDRESNLAHALDAEATAVWRACDGHSDIHTLVLRCRISRDNLENTLVRLRELRLLEGEQQGDTRRDALRKLTLAGAGLASVPTISSILVPTAAQAASCVVTITEYPIPPSGSNPLGPLPVGITSGPDGALWFTEAQSGKIGRVTTSGAFTEYSPPTGNSFPQAITRGPDGALWFVENANNIGRVTTSGASRSTRSRHA